MAQQIDKDLSVALKVEQLNHSLDQASKALKEFTKLAEGSQELRDWATNEIAKYALSIRASKLDKDELENFFKYPYCILPGKHEGEIYLAIPKFIDAHFGWLHKVTPSYNIFLVNRYVDWLGELPAALKRELKLADPLDVHLDGEYLVGPDSAKAYAKNPQFFTKQKDGKLLINKARHFDMLAALIKDGILPFVPKPVAKEDMVDRKCDFKLRDYQEAAWLEFCKYSNIGAFFPPSTGKTFLALYAMTHIKGPHLVVVPTRLLMEQWKERIELYTDLQPDECEVLTYHSGIKTGKVYKLLVIDEVHHLPANEFSKLSNVKREYCMGLSATPQREDQREEYIFALTGKPVGLAWETFKKLGIIQNPPLHVWIVKNEVERIKQLGSLLQEDEKTVIFCDSIELGTTVAKRFELPHIHGSSKERLAAIKDAPAAVVSRVGDEGISLPDISRVIEISWLHGSRRQELQRFTRLLHGQGTKGEAHIIMTGQEYQTDHKRLFGVMDKGFKIVLHREGISEKVINAVRSGTSPPRVRAPRAQNGLGLNTVQKPMETNDFERSHPLLGLPGTQKKLSSCSNAERLAIRVIYEKNKPLTKEEVWNFVGLGRVRDFANFQKLQNLKLIKKEEGKYLPI